ncbi:ferric reductase-like transmembrane domain-containing protein [Paenibacillus sp. PR3]|uniref:Ferric reductase-like transmembrane domain-containing protein n=1 Tax=Paenibacillus terricola TaxID=2763503 RepID=A0ABR8MTK5_9BACL|nr:ferric reductase-like transmembrane domain-containing protein [Paenibacillus terricola]MBD3917849.1 ferric reductase-like transmembrane domain-containing protein [Paenibacillus terricola]
MINWITSWPVWELTRVFGIAAYLTIFAGLTLGMLYSFPFVKGKRKAQVYRWHTYLTNGGTAVALLHAAILIISTYVPYRWADLLIPFASKQYPIGNGIGILALYGMLLLLITSDYRNKINRHVWLTIHLLAYPIFVGAAVHGYMVGTSSGNPLAKLMYGGTLLVVVVLFAVRASMRQNSKSNTKLRQVRPSVNR